MPVGLSGASCVVAGRDYSIVLKHDGSVWTTGRNQHVQLGVGSTTSKSKFERVVFSDTKATSAGSYHSMVLKSDDSVWTTGRNAYGQLGDGSQMSKNNFAQLVSGGVQAVAAGTDQPQHGAEDR